MKAFIFIGLTFLSNFTWARKCEQVLNKEVYFERGSPKAEVIFNSTKSYLRQFRQQNIDGRVADYFDPRFDTRVYFANHAVPGIDGLRPLVDPSSDGVVLFLHGSGTIRSSGKNFNHVMNSLSTLNVSTVAVDLPFHGEGPMSSKFEDPRYVTAWLHKIVTELKKSGKKVYLAGHSFGPSLSMEYMYDYPFGVDGALLVSPVAFNKELQKWYDKETSKMKFGDSELISHTVGGMWGDRMLNKFRSHLNPGVGDPTLINPHLKIIALTGDREEYAEAPLGGRKNLPIGKNTYSIADAIRKIFSRIDVTVAEGIGHYIFKHTDSNGQNYLMRELLILLDLKIDSETKIRELYLKSLSQDRAPEEQLWFKLHTDAIFQAWARQHNLDKTIRMVYQKRKSEVAKNLLEQFRIENEARKKMIVLEILQIATDNPQLLQKFANDIEDLKKYGLRDCSLLSEIDDFLP